MSNYRVRLLEIKNNLPVQLDLALKELGEIGVETAKSTKKFNVGKLPINFVPLSEHSGKVIADAFYASWLEYGNAQNQVDEYIYPTHAKALCFRSNGQTIFAKKVKAHEPYYFMRDAAKTIEENITVVVNKHLKQL